MSAEILASGKEKWQDLVVTPLLASKEAVIAWLDKVTKASDASQKATTQQEQGSLLQGIVNCGSICGTRTKTVPWKTIFVNNFSLFQLETKNSFFYKQWPYMVSNQMIFFVKKIIQKPAILNHFVML